MIDLFKLLAGRLVGLFRSHAGREAEIMFLRHQLLVLRRSAPQRLRLRTADRLIFVWLYRLCPSLLGAAIIIKPATLVRWHRVRDRGPSCVAGMIDWSHEFYATDLSRGFVRGFCYEFSRGEGTAATAIEGVESGRIP